MIGSDGYTYASTALRLLGEPEKTDRNREIERLRQNRNPEHCTRAYYEAYDACQGGSHYDRNEAGLDASFNAIFDDDPR